MIKWEAHAMKKRTPALVSVFMFLLFAACTDREIDPSPTPLPTEPSKHESIELWKQIYIDVLNDPDVFDRSIESFSLIYVDDDDIPELVFTPPGRSGSTIYTVSGGNPESISTGFIETYIERGNLFYSRYWTSGGSQDEVLAIIDGKFHPIHKGNISPQIDGNGEIMLDSDKWLNPTYIWNDTEISETGYQEKINEVFDTSRAVELHYQTADEIINRIRGL